ncbi:hypothetical protein H6P81_016464 [Aristolochia fimbriata]|uniref:Uncharacterized protein n=1 Tax=Aristolochia fimbriata TaxID=158543 RepID=A0AAV7E926_ARIFI|nr:hypothetical protein H6P81_016464 [Aristolochia fimbriata]
MSNYLRMATSLASVLILPRLSLSALNLPYIGRRVAINQKIQFVGRKKSYLLFSARSTVAMPNYLRMATSLASVLILPLLSFSALNLPYIGQRVAIIQKIQFVGR